MKCDLLSLHKLLGKKWSYGLLYALKKPLSFQEIVNCTGKDINQTLLSSRLKELTSFGLVTKEEVNKKFVYLLTPFGKDLTKNLTKIKLLIEENGCTTPKACYGKDCKDCPGFFKQKN